MQDVSSDVMGLNRNYAERISVIKIHHRIEACGSKFLSNSNVMFANI